MKNLICPYCFEPFTDEEVHFRSEYVSPDEFPFPEGYDDIQDFRTRYRGSDRDQLLEAYDVWEVFRPAISPKYEKFWAGFSEKKDQFKTTEKEPAAKYFGVEPYKRPVLDPGSPVHQKFLRPQKDGFFIRDENGMVSQIQLKTGEKCNRRVCPHCHNPLPDGYGAHRVRFVSVIGITGAGKTVYFSQLLKRMDKYAFAIGMSSTTTTASVQNFLEQNGVEKQKPLPTSTPLREMQQPLFYDMTYSVSSTHKETETLVLYDVPGEVFDPKKMALLPLYAPYIQHADGLILLISPDQFEVVAQLHEETRQLSDAQTALQAIHSTVVGGGTEKCTRPLAICVAQADQPRIQAVLSPSLRDKLLSDARSITGRDGRPASFFNGNDYNLLYTELQDFILNADPVLDNTAHTNYLHYSYFAFTALGCEVKRNEEQGFDYPVGPVLPKRIEEPLYWLLYKLGYMGTQGIPLSDPLCYPNCHSYEGPDPLPEDHQYVEGRRWFFFPHKIPATHICHKCGHHWVQEEGGQG